VRSQLNARSFDGLASDCLLRLEKRQAAVLL
jgi:hypothetical protein